MEESLQKFSVYASMVKEFVQSENPDNVYRRYMEDEIDVDAAEPVMPYISGGSSHHGFFIETVQYPPNGGMSNMSILKDLQENIVEYETDSATPPIEAISSLVNNEDDILLLYDNFVAGVRPPYIRIEEVDMIYSVQAVSIEEERTSNRKRKFY